MRYSKRILSSEKGFVLVVAIMACAILFALTLLIINLSTSDLRDSSKLVGEKKALTAAEAGLHRLIQNFDPQNLAASATTNFVAVDSTNDPNSGYKIFTPQIPATGPIFIPMTGYSIGGGQTWGQKRFTVEVEGCNTAYDTKVEIQTAVGYGPVEISTMYQ